TIHRIHVPDQPPPPNAGSLARRHCPVLTSRRIPPSAPCNLTSRRVFPLRPSHILRAFAVKHLMPQTPKGGGTPVAFNGKKRGKLTYYYSGDRPVLSALVTEEQPDGDLKIYFAGLTGGYSAKGVLGLETLTTMEPEQEIPLVFASWEKWLRDSGICESLQEI